MWKNFGPEAYKNFGDVFRSAYKGRTLAEKILAGRSAGQMTADSAGPALGHPEYIHLKPGETRKATSVVSFIDIRGFTKMSLALDATDLLRIVQALAEASIKVITDGGGYIGDFTGDGVMGISVTPIRQTRTPRPPP